MPQGAEMPELFADTSGWGHLVDPTQPFHTQAAALYRAARQQGRKVITTNYVLVELVALLTSPLRIPRSTTIAFIDGVKTSPYVEVVHVDAVLDGEAWQLLRSRPDKEWSLVDCASFVLMTRRGILEALTTDHHFEQAGFVRFLK
jgi:predicted nucleic acid-binding protein